MQRGGTIQRAFQETIREVYEQARGTWTGCDWPTCFGQAGLDLNGITSNQSLLMARATAGDESSDWREAVRWLRLVEADAEAAEDAARSAVELAERGDLAAARRASQTACDLEVRYHPRPVWAELRDALGAG